MKRNLFALTSIVMASLLLLASCSEDKATSELPVFGELTLSKTTLSPGDTLVATVTFSYRGSYVNGTYNYSTSPALLSGTTTCGSSSSSFTISAVIPEIQEGTQTYTLTITPKTMAAYAGDQPYIDPSPMGKLEQKFTVVQPFEN